MVEVFAKRFNGFDTVNWPVISFGNRGNRDALLRERQPGDLVLFIGTQGAPTPPEYRGRLLGLAEIGPIGVETLDYVDPARAYPPDLPPARWPHAIPMLQAWRLVDRPRVLEVLEKQLGYSATVRAVRLGTADREAVLQLDSELVPIGNRDLTVKVRLADINSLARSGPTRGPVPSSYTGTVARDADVPADTYAFRFGERDCWKIGHAQNVKARLAEVNRHIPFEILGEQWACVRTRTWPTQIEAYEMEQRLFSRLPRTEGERVACSYVDMEEAWTVCGQ
jgi:hypothetical protein